MHKNVLFSINVFELIYLQIQIQTLVAFLRAISRKNLMKLEENFLSETKNWIAQIMTVPGLKKLQ